MCVTYWFKGSFTLVLDEVLRMNEFRDGLAKIVSREVQGKVVMVMESADWATSSLSSIQPPIALGGEMKEKVST